MTRVYRQPWDAARAASLRSIRAYKPVAPVGVKQLQHPALGMQRHFDDGVYDIRSCDCGYHICGCTDAELKPFRDAIDEKIKTLMRHPTTLTLEALLEGSARMFQPKDDI